MTVIGVGGSDSLQQAESFAATYGGPPILLWSKPNDAWSHYRAGNPNLVLLDGAGVTEIGRMSSFDRDRIEKLLDGLA